MANPTEKCMDMVRPGFTLGEETGKIGAIMEDDI